MMTDLAAPPSIDNRRSGASWMWLPLSAAAAGGAAILFLFDPARHDFYPFCFFKATTGLDCPGCGMLRALHQLLHGHVFAAARLNLLLVVCLPFIFWLTARYAVERWRGQQAHWSIPPSWMWTFLALSVVFGTLRNLPGFEWLAP
ncbi:MAG TPA: DUF2752 domain-containing protein [Terriglobia bacterium]|nr:DUF2752 domain-containing protein [Terriglobia bacterium]